MTKAAHLLTSLIFAIVCGGLWGAWWIGEQYLERRLGGESLSPVMTYALIAYPWVLALLPVPAIIYSAVLMDRTELLPEKALLFFVVMALVSLVLAGVSGGMFAWELQGFVTHQPQTLG